jgi:hypothetical protein
VPSLKDLSNLLNPYYSNPEAYSNEDKGITSYDFTSNDISNIEAQIKDLDKEILAQLQIVYNYNDYMKRTQGGDKINNIFSVGSVTAETVNSYMSAVNRWVGMQPDNNPVGQLMWGTGTAIMGPVFGITMATEVGFSAFADFSIAVGNLFMPYPGQTEAENASVRIRKLENIRRKLKLQLNYLYDR